MGFDDQDHLLSLLDLGISFSAASCCVP